MKMRNTLSLLSRSSSPTVATPPQAGQPPSGIIPSIRLISATPSATGPSSSSSSSDASTSSSYNRSLEEAWASVPVVPVLAPKSDLVQPRKRLVPKKSKLSILSMGRDKEKNRGKDLSDVIRRVGVDSFAAREGFDIYVDPTDDPDIGEIVMVKKKKSRLALNDMAWGPLGEVTNVPKVPPKDTAPVTKVKNEEKEKWWTLGRGRKDSKEKTKENKLSSKRKSSPINPSFSVDDGFSALEFIYEPPRSKSKLRFMFNVYIHSSYNLD
jgi:serine/arginine repetitive matrix protein 2